MVLVEDLARVLEVEIVLGELAPGQRDDPVEVGADDAVLGRRRRQLLEPVRARGGRPSATCSGRFFSSSCSRSSLISACCSSPSPSSSWIAFSCWRRKNSRWPLSISLATCDWIFEPSSDISTSRLEDQRDRAQPLLDVDQLEQLLALVGLQPQRRGDQVAERARIVDVRGRELQLLGQVRRHPDDVRELLLDVPRQRLDLGRVRGRRPAGPRARRRDTGSSCCGSTSRTRCRPWTRMRSVPSGTLIILWTTATVPTE